MVMQCFVYKGQRKDDHYLYLPATYSADKTPVPAAILDLLGDLQLVTEFELHEGKHLAQADPQQVLSDLQIQGFYLQMPRQDLVDIEEQYFN